MTNFTNTIVGRNNVLYRYTREHGAIVKIEFERQLDNGELQFEEIKSPGFFHAIRSFIENAGPAY